MADLPKPTKKKTTNWSAIWVLPLIALAIGLWLGWKSMNEAGINITIYFENGEGIQVGKTQLMYKGIQVGKVTDLHVSDDIKGVVATVEVLKEAEPYLSKETRFWLVRPRVSLAGVTGLETSSPASTSPSTRSRASPSASTTPSPNRRRSPTRCPACTSPSRPSASARWNRAAPSTTGRSRSAR